MGCSNNWCIFLIIILLLCDAGCGCQSFGLRMWLQQRLWLLTFHKTAKVKTTALPKWQGGQTYTIFEKDQATLLPFLPGVGETVSDSNAVLAALRR